MIQMMARNWWMFALRGALAILIGLFIFVSPGFIIQLFGAYMLLDGILSIVHALTGRSGNQSWWVSLLEGVIGVLAGFIAFAYPGIAALSLVYVVAAWAILSGITEVFAAWQLRKQIDNEWWLGLAGVISVLFGILIFVNPLTGLLALTSIVAAYAIIFGVFLLLLAWRLRGMRDNTSVGMRA